KGEKRDCLALNPWRHSLTLPADAPAGAIKIGRFLKNAFPIYRSRSRRGAADAQGVQPTASGEQVETPGWAVGRTCVEAAGAARLGRPVSRRSGKRGRVRACGGTPLGSGLTPGVGPLA